MLVRIVPRFSIHDVRRRGDDQKVFVSSSGGLGGPQHGFQRDRCSSGALRLQAEVQENQVLQAALLRHGLLFLLSTHDLLCGTRLRSPGNLLRSASILLLGSDHLLFGSRGFVLHSGCHVLLGTVCQLLRSVGLVSTSQST